MSDYAPTLIPSIRYDDADAALTFLTEAFGMRPVLVTRGDDRRITHAELRFGTGMVMVGSTSDGSDGRLAGRSDFPGVYLVVSDADAACERARQCGATITREPADTHYGSRDFGAADPEGNVWWLGTYQPTDPPA